MKRILLFFILTAQFMLQGCTESDDCPYILSSAVAPAQEIANVQAYLTTNNLSATQHNSGLFYTISNPGSGASAGACSIITVRYTGKLTDGTVFDPEPPNLPAPTRLSLSDLIIGWQIGLPLIKSGGVIKLYIPPSLGYGNRSVGVIPPNSILIFELELLAVQ